MERELVNAVEKITEVTPTQKIVAYLNEKMQTNSMKLVEFCESRGIDISNIWATARLYQLEEQEITDFWNYNLQNNPVTIESLKDPVKLYQSIILKEKETDKKELRFLEMVNFESEEIERISNKIANRMIKVLEENKRLVLKNIEYLKELGTKNYKDIFQEYYELFLLDYSNFTGIFNKYDLEDLVEKLEKNIAIIEYL